MCPIVWRFLSGMLSAMCLGMSTTTTRPTATHRCVVRSWYRVGVTLADGSTDRCVEVVAESRRDAERAAMLLPDVVETRYAFYVYTRTYRVPA